MNTPSNNFGLADKIKEQIRKKALSMRPKSYFVLGAILLGSGLTLAVLIAVFFFSAFIFRLRVHVPFGFLEAGPEGTRAFLSLFPWIPLLLAIVAIAIGIIILRRYDFSYRHAFGGLLIGFAGTLIIIGVVVDVAGFPSWAQREKLYQRITGTDFEAESWVFGIVTRKIDDSFNIETPRGMFYTVDCTGDTIYHPPIPVINGEWVRILGEMKPNAFEADHVFHSPPPHGIRIP